MTFKGAIILVRKQNIASDVAAEWVATHFGAMSLSLQCK